MTAKRKRIALLLLPAFVLTLGAASFYQWRSSVASAARPEILASVEGLKPGSAVSYEVVSLDGQTLKGEAQAGAKGEISIPAYTLKSEDKGKPGHVAYSLEMKTEADPVRVTLNIDTGTGDISATGGGLQQFAGIEIANGSTLIKTKADWTGLFRDLTAPSGTPQSKKKNEYHIAFFNNGPVGAVADFNPLVITVQSPNFTNEIRSHYVRGLMYMTEQFSAVMMLQVTAFGHFFDAKQQMETQENLRRLQAEAHKDYHPSEMMCRFGSFVRSVARSEEKTVMDRQAINRVLMGYYTGEKNGSTSGGYAMDTKARLQQFREVYCDPQDNSNGLQYICQHDPTDGVIIAGEDVGGFVKNRFNKDIDYNRTLATPLTLDMDFSDDVQTVDEEDVLALAKNLYWARSLDPALKKSVRKAPISYMEARRLFAINNVAHNSFAALAAMKSSSQPGISPNSGPAFMKSLMIEMGVQPAEIDNLMGAYPSYYSQMEVLTKNMYQSPNFYTNLYDKPANVERIGVTMDAIKLMQGRDQFESALRREMLVSMMVEEALTKQSRRIDDKMSGDLKNIR